MSENKWTPGPWSISTEHLRGGKFWTVTRTDTSETIDLHEDDNGDADAHLIAAAPELYEACADIESKIVDYEAGRINWRPDDFLMRVRKAMAKARGEAQ